MMSIYLSIVVPAVMVTDCGISSVVGQNYTLTCSVSGIAFTSYQWRKDGSMIPDEARPTLSFSPLRLSDAGQYSCGNGTLFSNNVTVTTQSEWLLSFVYTPYTALCLMSIAILF